MSALALLVVGCSLGERFGWLGGGPQGLAFDHKLHYEDEGLDCSSCHLGLLDDEADSPGMPVLAQCLLCHEEIDSEKPPERRVETLFDGDVYRARGFSALSDEIVFSHPDHAIDEELCGSCHEGIESSQRLDERMAVSMDDCMACHSNLGVPNDCTTCHSEMAEDRPPPTHAFGWQKSHGQVFRSHSTRTANRCDLCHEEQDCNSCHFDVRPDNHTNYWRRRGHGITARMDRQSCSTCHRPDACDACHQEMQPQNHRGAWGNPLDNHCLSCHLSDTQSGCTVCHADNGALSHSQGTPQPPDHVPGMNCRQCHGISAPLPHVQKGEDCSICHR